MSDEGEVDLLEALMPEDQCARCGDREPEFWFLFNCRTPQESKTEPGTVENTVKLGFCSNECCAVFARGIEGVNEVPVS